jgi:hypothetical protein
MRCVAKGLGRGAEGAKETAPHSLTIAKSRLASNFLDWQPALLEHVEAAFDSRISTRDHALVTCRGAQQAVPEDNRRNGPDIRCGWACVDIGWDDGWH